MFTRPRLVFFQYRYDENLPEFLLTHKRDHVDTLARFFDVTVIDRDCDFQQVCDRHEPDMVLFESGVNHTTCRRLKIANARAYPAIPRAGLHNADAFCNARAGFLSDMEHWGIETFFAITTTAPEHMPEVADQFFIWPNCINPATYRDYGLEKTIPVLFSGNTNALYPWRHKILKLVSERYPSLICPHPGYEPGRASAQVLFGEPYARLINASAFVPACGTVAREVVRKHFEVPGSRACLVTERSATLEAAGFVDMENCLFVDAHDVLDKLAYLFEHRDALQQITDAGYELVHSRHTQQHRDQIFQWFTLRQTVQAHQRIVQDGPFGALRIVDESAGTRSAHVSGDGLHLQLLREGDAKFAVGQYAAAERAYLKCMHYMPWMPEPKLRYALCRLHAGDARAAQRWIAEPLEFTLGGYGALDPDPVEWAFHILVLIALGDVPQAVRAAREFAGLGHPHLDRMRTVVTVLSGEDVAPRQSTTHRASLHQIPVGSWAEWRHGICQMLLACGRDTWANQLASVLSDDAAAYVRADGRDQEPALAGDEASRAWRDRFRARNKPRVFRRRVADSLHRLEKKFGYFLPYEVSAIKHDPFFSQIRSLLREEAIDSVLMFGMSRRARRFERVFGSSARCHWAHRYPQGDTSACDAIVIDASVGGGQDDELERAIDRARVVIFDGLGRVGIADSYARILRHPDYVLVSQDPELRDGYAIFKRVPRRLGVA